VDGGALIFNQSTLSRKRKNQEQLEEQAKLNPSALSYKRPGIVTRPDVEHALVLWVKHMEEKRETIKGRRGNGLRRNLMFPQTSAWVMAGSPPFARHTD